MACGHGTTPHDMTPRPTDTGLLTPHFGQPDLPLSRYGVKDKLGLREKTKAIWKRDTPDT